MEVNDVQIVDLA
jgi:ethanolaminephosphotransferase